MTGIPQVTVDCPHHGKCTYWCPIHLKHHPVDSMVVDCLESSTKQLRPAAS